MHMLFKSIGRAFSLKKKRFCDLTVEILFQKSCSHIGARLSIDIETFTLIGFVLLIDSGSFENITLTRIPNSISEIVIRSFKQLKS